MKELFSSNASEETAKAEEDGSLKAQEVTLIFEGKSHTVTVLPSETILFYTLADVVLLKKFATDKAHDWAKRQTWNERAYVWKDLFELILTEETETTQNN